MVVVLLGSMAIDFFIARKVLTERGLLWLTIGVSLNLALLFYYKYVGFVVQNIFVLMGLPDAELPSWASVVLPVGISFFTFQKISYLVDVYRKEHDPLHNFWDYLLYILFFPKLIAGPIVRYRCCFVAPQVARLTRVTCSISTRVCWSVLLA